MRSLYSTHSNLIIGFHGCDKQLAEQVVEGKTELKPSENDYDWLGNGIYFWENNYDRALSWAEERAKRSGQLMVPSVLGAVIDLGYCLDLMDNANLAAVKTAHEALVEAFRKKGIPLPKNKNIGKSKDLLLRKLDCAVIQTAHELSLASDNRQYDSVRSMFTEGEKLYENSGFASKNHIQICVCNPNCIKGYFLPRKINNQYPLP